jgi:hypothetical protein
MWLAHGQRVAMRSCRHLPVETMRPAALNRRSRSRLGSQRRAVQGEHLGPGQQLARHCYQLAPDLVLGEAVEGKVARAGVFGGLDAVLTACAAAVAQFEIGELPALGVGGEAGEAVTAGVG